MIGKILNNRYIILEEIGIGGMSIVYKAKCKALDRLVAIKVLKREYLKDETIINSFLREAKSAASLSSPNIINIYDVCNEENIYYIVMEYINGKDLKKYIQEKGHLDENESISIGMKILEGLAFAHYKGIIHRDIKSQNIMITNDNIVKVTDFGIAKTINSNTLSRGEDILGSIHYMSPEQIKGEEVDIRSDIYSMGVVVYEMITGDVPFKGENLIEIAIKQVQEHPKPISKEFNISEKLEQIIFKTLKKNKNDRYDSIEELRKDIELLLDKDKEKPINNTQLFETQIIPKEELRKEIASFDKEKLKKNSDYKRVYLEEKEDTSREKLIKSGKDIFNRKKSLKIDKLSIKSYIISIFGILILLISIIYIFPIKTYYYKIIYDKTTTIRYNISNRINGIQN